MISLLHPSRGRPKKSFETTRKWIENAGCEVQLIVSCDDDDPSLDDYLKIYKPLDASMGDLFEVYVNPNDNVVQATNRACDAAVGDIYLYLSDDFDCFPDWGQAVLKEFENENRPLLLKVDDALQPFHVRVLTIPIMNRLLYQKLGYFWHPSYFSMHVDCDLYETVSAIGAMKFARHLKFPHNHVSVGKAEMDETYRRSSANWDQGLRVFNRRKAQKFPI